MSNLTVRIISSLVLLCIGYGALVWNLYSRWFIIVLLLSLAARECSLMVFHKFSPTLSSRLSWISALFTLLLLAPYFPGAQQQGLFDYEAWAWLVVSCAAGFYVLAGFFLVPIEGMSPWMFLNIMSVLFGGLWTAQVFRLTNEHPGFAGITSFTLVLVCVAAADTGAYFSGRAVGKHKLCPHISPKKTIEGLVGGTLLVLLLSSFLGPVLTGMSGLGSLGFGLLMAGTGAAGDLVFSGLKRYAGVKDSSNIIPGHGGVIDRFDGHFFSFPFAAVYLNLVSLYG